MPWVRTDDPVIPTASELRMNTPQGVFRVLRAVSVLLLVSVAPALAQDPVSVQVRAPDGPLEPALRIHTDRGFAAVPVEEVERLGWGLSTTEDGAVALWRSGFPSVQFRVGSPFLSWGEDGVQLTEAVYRDRGTVFLPVQFLIDILPWKLPQVYRYDAGTETLEVFDPDAPPSFYADPIRVVVIDPGHGGRDPGARGREGAMEKDVALAIGRILARELEGDANLEVYLTRDSDTLIPIWKRGELATRWRGEHPGIFVSIHANSLPGSQIGSGFETYFLSEARTEHERRVAALENAAQEYEVREESLAPDPDLSFILTELRSLDHQHWSALLAGLVQDELGRFHPGPNRGVKQGPLAVITNALMPAVLVEVGFITNPAEERILVQRSFQEETGEALAAAVREFFRRYPGGYPSPVEDQ